MTNFANMNRTDLRAACKEAGIQYSKLTVAGMRDVLAELATPTPIVGEFCDCPHCGTHLSNGVLALHDELGDGTTRAQDPATTNEFQCMGCNGQFGDEHTMQGFAATYTAHLASGKSKCASLRATAHSYTGTRKNFICDAMELAIKEATASANWAAMKRGEW
jgi:hypothetical protein